MASTAQPFINMRDRISRGSNDFLQGNLLSALRDLMGAQPQPAMPDPAWHDNMVQQAIQSFGAKPAQAQKPAKSSIFALHK